MADCILSIDQGTTSSRTLVVGADGAVLHSAQEAFAQHYPADGWVEHDPRDIRATVMRTLESCRAWCAANGHAPRAIGITNQRETTLVWDRETGEPVYNAIVWQDRRTAATCRELAGRLPEAELHAKTGLLHDPYFSATKIAWILENVDGARARAESGALCFGTVDSFLVWTLTGGAVHATDATNASRTNLYNIRDGAWDSELLSLFGVPNAGLPEVRDCAGDFGSWEGIPIRGVAGDQQAAAIGQFCLEPGDIKSTYGTGCFVLLNTGAEAPTSDNRLLATVAYQLDGKRTYALEGSIFIAGAGVQWLRDEMHLVEHASDTEAICEALDGNAGVYVVPAFTGLGAPYWEPDARGAVFGLTRGTGREHVVRATVEAVAYQTRDLLDAMARDGVAPESLKVDGGMVANSWMVQHLADVLDLPVERPEILETTAMGAAFLAMVGCGMAERLEDLRGLWRRDRLFSPAMEAAHRNALLEGWEACVKRLLPRAGG